jgi:hypothetical protein
MISKLKYLSNETVEQLRNNIAANLDRYRSGHFSDLMTEPGWSIELQLDVDLSSLVHLQPVRAQDAESSRLVWKALSGLTPSLAYEEGIWVRLTHIECLEYARSRWLSTSAAKDEIEAAIRKHFFADTLTKRRDDNAISRLWWNAFMANLIMPDTDLAALEVFLEKADFRLNFIERSGIGSRLPLAAAIVRLMQTDSWTTDREENFRAFMRKVNKLGGGVVFEAMPQTDIDAFTHDCARRANAEEVQSAASPAGRGDTATNAAVPYFD